MHVVRFRSWIVNLVDKRIEVCRQPTGDTYAEVQHFERGQSVALLEFPDVVVQVSDIIKG
jgi:Uma2 family endonuclease